ARLWRIVAAGVAHAVMDGVVPVVIVIRRYSVPAAILRLERVVRPTNSGVRACNNNPLAAKSERPDIMRVRVSNAGFDRRRSSGLQRRLLDRTGLRKVVVDKWVPLHTCDVWSGR